MESPLTHLSPPAPLRGPLHLGWNCIKHEVWIDWMLRSGAWSPPTFPSRSGVNRTSPAGVDDLWRVAAAELQRTVVAWLE